MLRRCPRPECGKVLCVAVRRRLPVLKDTSEGTPPAAEEDDAARPPWHWIGFGTVAIFATWLPLAYAAQALVAGTLRRTFGETASAEDIRQKLEQASGAERFRTMAMLAAPNVLAFAAAAFAGGFLVGRYGPQASAREAALAGLVTALFATVIAGGGLGLQQMLTAIVLIAVATGFAAWGGRFGRSRRPR